MKPIQFVMESALLIELNMGNTCLPVKFLKLR
jgi:hypothetical protein